MEKQITFLAPLCYRKDSKIVGFDVYIDQLDNIYYEFSSFQHLLLDDLKKALCSLTYVIEVNYNGINRMVKNLLSDQDYRLFISRNSDIDLAKEIRVWLTESIIQLKRRVGNHEAQPTVQLTNDRPDDCKVKANGTLAYYQTGKMIRENDHPCNIITPCVINPTVTPTADPVVDPKPQDTQSLVLPFTIPELRDINRILSDPDTKDRVEICIHNAWRCAWVALDTREFDAVRFGFCIGRCAELFRSNGSTRMHWHKIFGHLACIMDWRGIIDRLTLYCVLFHMDEPALKFLNSTDTQGF